MEHFFLLYGTPGNLLNANMVMLHRKQDKANNASGEAGSVTYDDLLVAVGKSRNRDAFVRLFEYFAPRIKSYLMKGGITQELADELAQETMLSVWQKASGYDPKKAAASTWIFSIARNKRTDYFRKAGRPEPDADDPMLAPEIVLPDDQVTLLEQSKHLETALKELPEDQAELIRKSFFEEKTHADIAKETNLPLGTVKSRIRLALEKLRYHMGTSQ